MPKVLFVNCSCYGSTGKIISDIADCAVNRGFECVLCSPLGDGTNQNIKNIRTSLPYEQGIYRRINGFFGYQYGFAPLSTQKIKATIKKEKPDIVHLHCTNGSMVNIYSLAAFLKKKKIPTVITNHAEFFYTGSCSHAQDCERWKSGCGKCPRRLESTGSRLFDPSANAFAKMKKAFYGMNAVMVSVSPWVAERAAQSPITAGLAQKTVLNGVNTDIFYPRDVAELQKKHGLDESTRVIFHVTSNFSDSENDIKGGRYLLELARRTENTVFFIAGNREINFELPKNVIPLGRIADQSLLAGYYSMADLTVLTSKRETFGMAVAESLCCGTPVAAFYSGGSESIAIDEFCRFAEFGSVDGLHEAVRTLLSQELNKEELAMRAKEKYDSRIMANQYIDIYNDLI